jgi:hypothetical protein
MVFILVTSHNDATRDDSLMVTFLDYIINKDRRFQNSRILLLISQWDTFKGEIDLEDFIEKRMPLTYARLRNATNAFRGFSLGRIQIVDELPFIQEYDSEPAEKVFLWLYKTLTGSHLTTWWQRFRERF